MYWHATCNRKEGSRELAREVTSSETAGAAPQPQSGQRGERSGRSTLEAHRAVGRMRGPRVLTIVERGPMMIRVIGSYQFS